MSYHSNQFRKLVVRTLAAFDPELCSESATTLLLLTAAVESKFGRYLMQTTGPAIGAFQMEPQTFLWLLDKFAKKYPELAGRRAVEMEWDLRLAIIMCRLRYRVIAEPLPDADDINGMAGYWKRHYNTVAGKGVAEEAVANYQQYVI